MHDAVLGRLVHRQPAAGEHGQHAPVAREHLGRELRDPLLPRDERQVPEEQARDPLAVEVLLHGEGDLGAAAGPRRPVQEVAPCADDRFAPAAVRYRDHQRDGASRSRPRSRPATPRRRAGRGARRTACRRTPARASAKASPSRSRSSGRMARTVTAVPPLSFSGRGVVPCAGPAHAAPPVAWAWIAVIAMVLTMSVTVQPRLRSLTGLFRPCSTGPIATASAARWTAL